MHKTPFFNEGLFSTWKWYSSSAISSVLIEHKATASGYRVALSHKSRMYHFSDRLRERGPTISIGTLLNGVSIIGRGMSGAGCI